MNEKQTTQLKDLITQGKEQGFLTYAQVNDHLPDDIVDPEQIEDIINMINDMGISVHEVAPDADTLLLNDSATTDTEDDTAAGAAIVRQVGICHTDAVVGIAASPGDGDQAEYSKPCP